MALLKFKKGLYAELPEARVEGTVYITTDEKAMYVDINSTDRIRIGQIITLTKSDWQNLSKPFSEDVFYYITDINALIRWNGTAWVQINSTEALSNRITTLETALNGDGTENNKGLIATVATHGTDINGLKTTVGNAESGLVKEVADIRKELEDVISEGGEPNTIEKITIGGTEATITEKTVALGKLAGVDAKVAETDLHNDLKTKIDAIQTTANAAATKTYVDGIVGAEGTLTKKVEANTSDITNIKNTLGNDFSTTATVTAAIRAINSKDTEQDGKITDIEKDIGALETLTQEHVGTLTSHGNAIAANAQLAQQGVDAAAAAAQAAAAADTKAGNAQTAADGAQTTANEAKQLATANGIAIGTLQGKVQTLETNAATYATKTDLANQKTELEGQITTAQNAAEAAQDTADEAKGAAATNAGEIEKINTAIGGINTALGTKVDTETYEARVGENGTLTKLAQRGVDDAATAQTKANENAGLIATNTENIGKNATAISELKEQIGNISNVMNFRGAVETYDDLATITDPQDGDVVVVTGTGAEYVYSDGAWVEFGYSTSTSVAIANLDSRVTAAEGKITTLEGTVGDSTKGLVKDVADHGTKLGAHDIQLAELLEAMTWGSFTTSNTEE